MVFFNRSCPALSQNCLLLFNSIERQAFVATRHVSTHFSQENKPVILNDLSYSNYLLTHLNNKSKCQHIRNPLKLRTQPLSFKGYSTSDEENVVRSGISDSEHEMLRKSGRVVWGAVIINACNFLAKSACWIHTGSHSLFAEAIHSLADTANQLILAVGIRKSIQRPTADHPYGYHPMRYIAPLISGVGIFCVGCGLSIYHGVEAIISTNPEVLSTSTWAYGVIGFSMLSETITLLMALKILRMGARQSNMTMREYIKRNSDPGLIVVLLEDSAAVLGVVIAATCMNLSSYYDTHLFDAAGSLMIGTLLGVVASFIIRKNTGALVGKSIPNDTLNSINRIIEKDVMIRAIHDVKATILGNGIIRYKAEVDVDGRELSRKYLESMDLTSLLDDIKLIKNEKDVQTFIMTHGEGIIDLLGAEVDRIEKELRVSNQYIKV